MVEERRVDFAAVGRVARRVDLRDVRLLDLSAKLISDETNGVLTASTQYKSTHETTPGVLSVNCGYSFAVTSADKPVAEVSATYQIIYDVRGPEEIPDADLSEFASANGVYHSWPFLRQLVFDFTAKIGFPPYTLPVFLLNPLPKPAPPKPSAQVGTEPEGEAQP